jgi:hypothetical protein
VYFEATSPGGADDITVTGCDFVATFQNTITCVGNSGQYNSSNVTVSNNTLTNCGTGRGLTGGGESECVGINAQGWQTGSITDNVITNQGGEGIQILSGATGITVDGNSVVNPYVTGIYVSSGYGNGGNVTNIVVSNNYVELGAMSISPNYSISTESATDRIDTVAFHHNVSKGNGTAMGGLLFGAGQYGAPIRNCKIFHNVFVYDIYGIKAFGPTDDTSNHFGNNIISVGVNGRAYWVGTRAFSNALANYNIDYDLMFGPSAGTLIVEWGTGTFYTLAQWRANSVRTGITPSSRIRSSSHRAITTCKPVLRVSMPELCNRASGNRSSGRHRTSGLTSSNLYLRLQWELFDSAAIDKHAHCSRSSPIAVFAFIRMNDRANVSVAAAERGTGSIAVVHMALSFFVVVGTEGHQRRNGSTVHSESAFEAALNARRNPWQSQSAVVSTTTRSALPRAAATAPCS